MTSPVAGRQPVRRAPRHVASLLSLGLLSILGQVVLLRELAVASFGVELIYLLGFGIWLAWAAAGASLGRRSASPDGGFTSRLLVLFAVQLPASVAFLRWARILFGGVPGSYLPLAQQLLAALLALGPSSLLLGLLFQRLARTFVSDRGSLAAAYGWESAGGAAGGLAATASLRLGTPNFALALGCSLAAVVASRLVPNPRGHGRAVAGLTTVALAGLLAVSQRVDFRMTGWTHPDLLGVADSPYGRIAVTGAAGQVAVFENDALTFESESTEAEVFVHLAALQRDRVDRVLVLGGGAQGIVAEILRHRPTRVLYGELDPVFVQTLAPHLGPAARYALEAGPVEIVYGDPRRILSAGGAYDLILVGMPEPASAQGNRYYTREFFQECGRRLAPAGVLAFRLPSAENFRASYSLGRAASIYGALAPNFGDVVVVPAGSDVFLASSRPLARDPETLVRRLEARGIRARLLTPEYVRYLYTNDRFFQISSSLTAGGAPPNTDATPVCFRYSSLLWLSQFLPGALADPEVSLRVGAGVAASAIVLLLLLLARGRKTWRRTAIAGFAGLAGMVTESVLFLHYQIGSGVLYQDVGILVTSFMAGLALGGLAGGRLTQTRLLGRSALASFAVLNALVAWGLWIGAFRGLGTVSCLLCAAGFLVANLFAWASLQGADDEVRRVSPLYAADLLGGCLGSLLAALVLIPLLGLVPTAWGTALLAAAALLLV